MKSIFKLSNLFFLMWFFVCVSCQTKKDSIEFLISMENPSSHTFQITMICTGFDRESMEFKMPVWTPGYYQRLDFAKNVENFDAKDGSGNTLSWEVSGDNGWRVQTNHSNNIILNYDVKTSRSFVAIPYLDENHAYIVPTGLFMYIGSLILHPATVTVQPYNDWDRVATGLEPVKGKSFTYTAADFDILYDSPLLVGKLKELPSFEVGEIPHYFIGYELGEFDEQSFIEELKKSVTTATELIGEIPYKDYTFIAIGPGFGGIEHINSTTFGFNGNNLNDHQSRIRNLFFLTHEYFHHYNVKRIRPIELGPFDYDKGSFTNMLWVSEGLSVYYEYLIVKRAGLCSEEELFDSFRSNMMAFENKPGKQYQTLEQASSNTWSDGPFGRTDEEVNKTISYYDKGPVVGILFDFKIRNVTNNEKSLDDVMRTLYTEYYKQKQRGFTEDEFREVCERIAGVSLKNEFEYVTTTRDLNYPEYFEYAGLKIDTTSQIMDGGWLGISGRPRNDTLFVTSVDWQSPAWSAGIKRGDAIMSFNGSLPNADVFRNVIPNQKPGRQVSIGLIQGKEKREIKLILGQKKAKTFQIRENPNPTPLQKAILNSWLNK